MTASTVQGVSQCDCVTHVPCPCDGKKCRLCAYDPRHGTGNAYGNLKCRCDSCRAALAEAMWHARRRRREQPVPDHVHGTENGYANYLCRCKPCSKANNKARLEQYHRQKAGLTDVSMGLAGYPHRRKRSTK